MGRRRSKAKQRTAAASAANRKISSANRDDRMANSACDASNTDESEYCNAEDSNTSSDCGSGSDPDHCTDASHDCVDPSAACNGDASDSSSSFESDSGAEDSQSDYPSDNDFDYYSGDEVQASFSPGDTKSEPTCQKLSKAAIFRIYEASGNCTEDKLMQTVLSQHWNALAAETRQQSNSQKSLSSVSNLRKAEKLHQSTLAHFYGRMSGANDAKSEPANPIHTVAKESKHLPNRRGIKYTGLSKSTLYRKQKILDDHYGGTGIAMYFTKGSHVPETPSIQSERSHSKAASMGIKAVHNSSTSLAVLTKPSPSLAHASLQSQTTTVIEIDDDENDEVDAALGFSVEDLDVSFVGPTVWYSDSHISKILQYACNQKSALFVYPTITQQKAPDRRYASPKFDGSKQFLTVVNIYSHWYLVGGNQVGTPNNELWEMHIMNSFATVQSALLQTVIENLQSW
ncbi:hypothetical protein HDU77_011736, partial [Chytriomyces hyalinus]